MQLKISKIVVVAICCTSIYANEILSPQRLDSLKLSNEQIEQNNKKLNLDWINPITYTYSYADNENSGVTKQSIIAINQPIFKSGGIYNAIKYAQNIKSSSELSLDLQRKSLITQALTIAYNIQKLDLQIKKQQLNLENAQIDLKIKKESVFNGLLDISFLNNAIITKNNLKSALLDLKYQKESLLLSFKNLSSKDIKEIKLPILEQISIESYNKNNLNLQKTQVDIKTQKNIQWMTTSQYLPSVNVNYSKTINHTADTDVDTYGFNVVVPLNVKGYYDSGAAKVEYLKAQKDFEIEKIEERNFFYQKELKLKTIDAQITLTNENILSYSELLDQTIELENVGLKTKDDIKVLENSKKSEQLNLSIYAIDKQLELLEIYGKLAHDTI